MTNELLKDDLRPLIEARLLPRSKLTVAELLASLRSGHAYDPDIDAHAILLRATHEGEDAADLIEHLLATLKGTRP